MVGEVRSVVVRLSANVASYVGGMGQADAATAKVERGLARLHKQSLTTDQTMTRVGKVGGRLFIGAAAGIAVAEKKAADFNAEMATVYTLSHANEKQQRQLASAAKTVGINIGVGATDAARAEEELIKAGVKLKDIFGGGLKGALDLAAAGQTDVATATEVTASAMTQFNLRGKDVPHIADLLAAGADKALGSVTDLGYGLSQVGTQAHQMGFSIEDTVGTLAEFAQSGLTGERGGTVLKQMFLQLAAPTKNAKELMDRYGVSLYNAQGQIKTMPELAGNLQKAFEDLTPAQRNAALGVIFGSRAIQGANILIKDGADKNRAWIKTVNDQGFAAQQASGKMDSLKGDLAKLGAVADKAFIDTAGDQGGLRGLVKDITSLVKAYDRLSSAQKGLVLKGFEGAAVVGGALWTANKIYQLSKGTAGLYRGIGGILRGGGAAKGVAGAATGLATGRGVVPVFVTNEGFGGGGAGLPGGGKPGSPVIPALAPKAAIREGEKATAKSLLKTLGPLGAALAGGSFAGPGLLAGGVTLGSRGNETRKGFKSPDLITPAQYATLNKSQKALLGLTYAQEQAAKGQKAVSYEFAAGYNLLSKVTPSMGKYAKTLRTIPKDIRSYVSTPGAALSVASMGRLRREYHLTPKQVRTVMQLQGFSETQIRIVNAGRAFRALPKQVRTAIRTPGAVESKADVLRLQRQYHLTPKQVQTVIHVSGVDDAIAKARALRIAIANIRSKSVTISEVVQRSQGGGKYRDRKADGGTIPGPRTPYGDKVLIHAAPGEEVITNRHGEADRFRADRAAGRIPAYAEGGTVGYAGGGTVGYQPGGGINVYFPAPATLTAAVTAANAIAAAAANTARSAADTRTAHLDDLHLSQQIRDTAKSLAEHEDKVVGKGKHKKTLKGKGRLTLIGLDRTTAAAELADLKAQQVALRAVSSAAQTALDAIRDARTEAQNTLTGATDLFARGASGGAVLSSVNRDVRDITQYGQNIAALRDKNASAALLTLIKSKADAGDFVSANRLARAVLESPALLGNLNAALGARDAAAASVANVTTDPRFLGAGAWNPTSIAPSVAQVVYLQADPSTWMTELAARVTHSMTTSSTLKG